MVSDQIARGREPRTVADQRCDLAEVSASFQKLETVEAGLRTLGVQTVPIPREALFLAGKAFVQYRRAGGVRTGVLPDFFIGAHAANAQLPLLTRDTRHYRTYFPTVELIVPDGY